MREGVFGEILCLGNGVDDLADFLLELANEHVEWDSRVWVLLKGCLDDFFDRHTCKIDVLVWRVFVDGGASNDT